MFPKEVIVGRRQVFLVVAGILADLAGPFSGNTIQGIFVFCPIHRLLFLWFFVHRENSFRFVTNSYFPKNSRICAFGKREQRKRTMSAEMERDHE